MLETPHVIVAAAIAYKTGNPALALPLSLGSHFVLEKVPHWNPHLNTEIRTYGKLTKSTMRIIFFDLLLAGTACSLIAYSVLPDFRLALLILASGFLGILPDVVEAPYFLWKKRNFLLDKLLKFQKAIQNDTTVLPGITNQLLTIAAALVWIYAK